jgi:hypothetical protein
MYRTYQNFDKRREDVDRLLLLVGHQRQPVAAARLQRFHPEVEDGVAQLLRGGKRLFFLVAVTGGVGDGLDAETRTRWAIAASKSGNPAEHAAKTNQLRCLLFIISHLI